MPPPFGNPLDVDFLNAHFAQYLESYSLSSGIGLAPYGLETYQGVHTNECYISIAAASI